MHYEVHVDDASKLQVRHRELRIIVDRLSLEHGVNLRSDQRFPLNLRVVSYDLFPFQQAKKEE